MIVHQHINYISHMYIITYQCVIKFKTLLYKSGVNKMGSLCLNLTSNTIKFILNTTHFQNTHNSIKL